MNLILLKKNLKSNTFVKNVLILGSGTGLAQLVPALAALLLARLYTKSDFGYLSLFMAITGVVGCVATLRYELAIILPKKHNDAKILLIISIVNSFVFSLFCFVLLVLLDKDLLKRALDVGNTSFLYLIPLGVFFIGVSNSFTNWFARLQTYKTIAKARVVQSLTTAILKLLFGVIVLSWGLIYGTVFGYIIPVILFSYFFRKEYKTLRRTLSISKGFKLYREYIDFLKFSTLSGLFNSFSNIGLPMLITFFYGVENAGLYFFSNNLIRLPFQLLTQSISQVYKRDASVLFHKSPYKLLNFTIRIQLIICVILIPIILILSVFGGDLFSFFFGETWKESGELIKYIAVFVLFNNLYSPISSIADILREQKVLVLFNISLSLSQVLMLYLFQNVSFSEMLLIISIAGSLHFIVLDFYMKSRLRMETV